MTRTAISISLLVSFAFASSVWAAAHELPMFGPLPHPGKNWSKVDGPGTTDGLMRFSWINFRNTESGDVLSFVAWQAPGAEVTHSPVRQASIETFNSDGYAFLSTSVRGIPISDTIRNRFVSIDVRNHAADMKFKEKAIEYTYVFESSGGVSSTMAHGYVIVLGKIVLFVRHTSKDIITSDLARDIVFGLVREHFKAVSGIDKGWSFGLDEGLSDDTDAAGSNRRTNGSSQ
jgi:hypothetical protein